MKEYELKLGSGKTIKWAGSSGEDASRRFVDCRREETVVAWREADRYGLHVYNGGATN